jgi:hypothetical protein
MEVNGQLHVPSPLLPGQKKKEKKRTLWIGGYVGPRAGLEAVARRRSQIIAPVREC